MGWSKAGMLLSQNVQRILFLCTERMGVWWEEGRLQIQEMEELPLITCWPCWDAWQLVCFLANACLLENVFKGLSLALGAFSLREGVWWSYTVYLSCVGYNPVPIIPALNRLRQKNYELAVSLGYVVRPCSPNKNLIPEGRIFLQSWSFCLALKDKGWYKRPGTSIYSCFQQTLHSSSCVLVRAWC